MTLQEAPTQVVPTPQIVLELKPVGTRTRYKQKGKKEKASNTPSSRVSQPYALCEAIRNPIKIFH